MAQEQGRVRLASHPRAPAARAIGQGPACVLTAAPSGENLRRCPHLQEQVAKLRAQIPEKYLKKEPKLVGPGRGVDLGE